MLNEKPNGGLLQGNLIGIWAGHDTGNLWLPISLRRIYWKTNNALLLWRDIGSFCHNSATLTQVSYLIVYNMFSLAFLSGSRKNYIKMHIFQKIFKYNSYFGAYLFFFWVELYPPQKSWILIPSTSECDLNWRSGLCRDNQVKMKSLGWALIWYDRCPYKKRKFRFKERQANRENTV